MQKVPKPLPTQLISKLFRYIPETGELFWKHMPDETNWWNAYCEGKPAGTINRDGYVRVAYRGYRWMAHRVVWFLVTGEDNPCLQIDHINGIKHDNRFDNLRLVDAFVNCGNRATHSKKDDLPLGVSKRNIKYCAIIYRKGVKYDLGLFDTAEEASLAYQTKKKELDGDVFVDRTKANEVHNVDVGRHSRRRFNNIKHLDAISKLMFSQRFGNVT